MSTDSSYTGGVLPGSIYDYFELTLIVSNAGGDDVTSIIVQEDPNAMMCLI